MSPENDPLPIPDPGKHQPEGLSSRAKRWMFLGVLACVFLIILANIVGSPPTTPVTKPGQTSQQQQSPTEAQIRETEADLYRQQAALLEKTARDASNLQQAQAKAANPNAAEQLALLQQAAQNREQYQQAYGGLQSQPDAQKAQLEAEQRQQERKALFADNVVRQDRPQTLPPTPTATPEGQTTTRTQDPVPAPTAVANAPQRKPLDFDPSLKTVWLPEGTVMEAVLTNRLDGDGAGPVNCMITTDVYAPATRLIVIPQGARVLGEASKVTTAGQQRLAVAFHRILVPGLHEYSIPLDSKPPALAQAGEAGLHDKVNSHYAQIFGASLAIGAIGGLAQIGNGQTGFGFDPEVQFRNGVSQSMAQSSERILDRFLNRLPSITIREGTRTKILLTDDLQLPGYPGGV